MIRASNLALLLLIVGSVACMADDDVPSKVTGPGAVALERLFGDLPPITAIVHADDGSGRLYLALQRGEIRLIGEGGMRAEPLLDIRALISCCGEEGLLGVAFHPGYRDNGRLFVSYTATGSVSTLAEYRIAGDPPRADPASARILLQVRQPTVIHNGGTLAFGPDGMLYLGLGDGGHFGDGDDSSGSDPANRGQDHGTLLGKLLRIDVDRGDPYTIPADNPFATTPGARGEIWALGLRNPWRFGFDSANGDLYIADVGPSSWEEINLVPAGRGGINFGWRRMVGHDCLEPGAACRDGTLTLPIVAYGHDDGCAVIGGHAYRGTALPELAGAYLFGDFCSGIIWATRKSGDGSWQRVALIDTPLNISTFGEDEAGEIYVAHYHPEESALYRIVSTGGGSR